MEARIVPEHQMLEFKGDIPQDMVVTYLKLVSVGPEALKEVNGDAAKLKEKCASQPGFFLITKEEELEATLQMLSTKFSEKVTG